MQKKIIGSVIVVALLAGVLVFWHFLKADPAQTAENFLGQLTEKNWAGLEDFFDQTRPYPQARALEEAFQQFAENFALAEIELLALAPGSQRSKEALFSFALAYRSVYFPPLRIEANLRLVRTSVFRPWQVVWEDNLPLPQYGLEAFYSRTRVDPLRAEIQDSQGRILAGAGSLVKVGVQPDRISDPQRLLAVLEEELDLDPDYVQSQYLSPGVQGHWFVPLLKISEERYRQVDASLRPVPGIFFQRESSRAYPQGPFCAHLTGYLGEVTQAMLEAYPGRDYQSGEVVGRSGLELSQDDSLRGRPGYRFFVQREQGERILVAEKPVVLGRDLRLTLDAPLQSLAFDVLGERAGALVVLDAQSGAVLVLASTPSFDPNEFSVGISSQRWRVLSEDPQNPMFNRALQGLYPPGSVFKVLTIAAALDQGLYEAGSQFTDSGELRVEGNLIRNFQNQVFGEHTLQTALVQSINTTVAQVGLDLGASLLTEYFQAWGLDQEWPLGLPLQKGQIGSPARSKVALAWSALGQDQVLLTPLHLAQIFSVFANEGRLPPVHLLADAEKPEASPVLKPETAAQIRAMLREVVLEGTGRGAQVDGLEIFGKTGTAETVGGGMHAWFAGHVQIPQGPTLAFALLVEEGGVGGQAAAPLVSEFFRRLSQ